MRLKPTKELIEAMKSFEGLRLKSYTCPSGVWTIGYGHTRGVTPGMVINEAWADSALKQDVSDVVRQLDALRLDFEKHGQLDAVVDFVFNIGITKFRQSSLLRHIREKAADDIICAEFRKWVYGTVKGKKVKLSGLVRRRDWEAKRWSEKD